MSIGLNKALAFMLAVAVAAPAAAQEAPNGISLSGDLGVVSDYRFRGLTLSGGDPAVQGGLYLSHSSGLYGGTWMSTIDGDDLYGDVEVDLVGGWAGEVLPGTTFDASLAYYAYPDGKDGAGPADYLETTAKLSRALGPVEATVGAAYSWEQKALGGDNLYLFTDAAMAVPATPITLNAHAGYSKGAMAFDGDYVDWLLGAEYEAGPVTLGVSYVGTDLRDIDEADDGIVFSLTASF